MLSAAMVCRGWRLLSDEMTLLSVEDGLVYPVPRPVSLKNQSLDVIRKFSPHAIIGPVVNDTLKGTVGHMRPPDSSVENSLKPAQPAKVIFPKYLEGSRTELTPLSKARTLLKLAENCFNYSALGKDGFNSLGRLCDAAECYDFSYSNLDEAIALFTELAV
jgi:HprK-related kinase A